MELWTSHTSSVRVVADADVLEMPGKMPHEVRGRVTVGWRGLAVLTEGFIISRLSSVLLSFRASSVGGLTS